MNIVINGHPQQLTSGKILSDIVASYGKPSRHIIAELNGAIVPFDQWAQTSLKDGDALELVTFVGGG
jgi:sulfur carrier protein